MGWESCEVWYAWSRRVAPVTPQLQPPACKAHSWESGPRTQEDSMEPPKNVLD